MIERLRPLQLLLLVWLLLSIHPMLLLLLLHVLLWNVWLLLRLLLVRLLLLPAADACGVPLVAGAP